MTETIRLFDTDSYIREFKCRVISCLPFEEYYDLITDKTAFFPEEGGQSCDTGFFYFSEKQINVIKVFIKENVIHHIVDTEIPADQIIAGCINWNIRFSNMQQHSGEHLLSGYVNKVFGFDNVGFHLSASEVTLDFNGIFTSEQVANIELEVNKAILANVKTVVTFPSTEELKGLTYRSKKELFGQVRIVSFPGYDICACCAPHVASTSEIGILKILSAEHFRSGTRMSIVCGYRALLDYRFKHNECLSISVLLSVKQTELTDSVKKLLGISDGYKYKIVKLQEEVLKQKVNQLDALAVNPVLFTDECDAMIIRNTVNLMVSTFHGYCSVFTGNDTDGYKFITGSSDNDCKMLLADFKERFNAKGGGNSAMIQGTINLSMNEITDFISKMTE